MRDTQTCCAHCHVIIGHHDHPDGTRTDYWECADGCGQRFVTDHVVRSMKESHVMQLAAISTASVQNTRETIKDRITPDNPYYTTAYADVCRAIDREIGQRERAEEISSHIIGE